MGSIRRKIFLYLIGQIESLGHILKRLSQLCNGNLTYGELITLQILRYQYPNGHKTQLSPSLVQSLGEQFSYETFSELQAACNILLRPAVLVWQVQNRLWDKGQPAFLSQISPVNEKLLCYLAKGKGIPVYKMSASLNSPQYRLVANPVTNI